MSKFTQKDRAGREEWAKNITNDGVTAVGISFGDATISEDDEDSEDKDVDKNEKKDKDSGKIASDE